MTNEEINKALHEALGKCLHTGATDCMVFKCDTCLQTIDNFTGANWQPPDYTNDLNAVAEAERFVIEKVGTLYATEYLYNVVSDNETFWPPEKNELLALATASALQKATACLKALGVKG